MKFSICTTYVKQKKLEDIVELAACLGLDGVEIWDGHIDEYIKRNNCSIKDLKRLLDGKKLVCSAVAPYFNLLDKDNIKSSLGCADKCVGYGEALDCKVIRTFVGNKPSSEVSCEEWKGCISALKSMTDMAEHSNIDFALETHYNQPTDTVETVLNMIEKTGNTHLKVLFDGFNYFVDGLDMMEAHYRLDKHIVHYHLKNYYWTERVCMPLNKGDVDFMPLILAIKEKGYEGFASFEYFCKDPKVIIKQSLDWVKSVRITENV